MTKSHKMHYVLRMLYAAYAGGTILGHKGCMCRQDQKHLYFYKDITKNKDKLMAQLIIRSLNQEFTFCFMGHSLNYFQFHFLIFFVLDSMKGIIDWSTCT